MFAALKAEGYSILFITHKLREVLRCADRITVLRRGRVAGGFGPCEAREEDLVAMMFGNREAEPQARAEQAPRAPGAPVLELRSACCAAAGSETALRDLDSASARARSSGWRGSPAAARRSWAT